MSQNTFYPNYERLMQSQKYSDLVLSCQGSEFKVHKAIVCAQSPVLAAACDGVFKEAISNNIQINGFDAETVKRMILFMYTQTYHDSSQEESDISGRETDSVQDIRPQVQLTPQAESQIETQTASETVSESEQETDDTEGAAALKNLLSHVKMNAIADYYDIPELRRCANTRLQSILEHTPCSFWSADSFCIIIREVFNSTADKELHNILAVAMAAHIDKLFFEGDENIALPDVMSGFAFGVIRKIVAARKATENSLTLRIQDLELRLRETENELERQKQTTEYEKTTAKAESIKKERLQNEIDKFSELLHRTKGCRNTNCDAEFRCYLEEVGHVDFSYTLRCARCHCRHKY